MHGRDRRLPDIEQADTALAEFLAATRIEARKDLFGASSAPAMLYRIPCVRAGRGWPGADGDKKMPTIGRPCGRKPLLNLRVPQPLYDAIAATAEASGKTISQEAVSLLERKLTKRKQQTIFIKFRLPVDVHERIVAIALQQGRSMNSVVVEACSKMTSK